MTRMRKVIIIEKRESDKKTIKKLRPIRLLSAFYKIISNILATRIRGTFLLDPILPPNQNAYVPGRSCCNSVATINDALGIAKLNKNDIFLVSTDLRAAFDTISRKIVIKII